MGLVCCAKEMPNGCWAEHGVTWEKLLASWSLRWRLDMPLRAEAGLVACCSKLGGMGGGVTAALAQAGRGEKLLDGLPLVRRACPLDQSRSCCGFCMGAFALQVGCSWAANVDGLGSW